MKQGLANGNLAFTTKVAPALSGAEVVWVAYDTPVDDQDQADVEFVLVAQVEPDYLVLYSFRENVVAAAAVPFEFAWVRVAVAANQEILRLDILVNDTVVVRVLKRIGCLVKKMRDVDGREQIVFPALL